MYAKFHFDTSRNWDIGRLRDLHQKCFEKSTELKILSKTITNTCWEWSEVKFSKNFQKIRLFKTFVENGWCRARQIGIQRFYKETMDSKTTWKYWSEKKNWQKFQILNLQSSLQYMDSQISNSQTHHRQHLPCVYSHY